MKRFWPLFLPNLILSQLYAFTLNPQTGRGFDKNTINVIVSNTDCTLSGFSTEEFKSYLEDAASEYWNSVGTSSLKLNIKSINTTIDISGLTFREAIDITPAKSILAGCNTSGDRDFDGTATPSGNSAILGAVQMSCSGDGCRSALIMNSHPTNLVSNLSKDQVIATIAHELGHAIGLGHSNSQHNLMYFSVGGKNQTWLGDDDIKGVTYLYPHEQSFSCLLGSFGTIRSIENSNDKSNNNTGPLYSLLLGLVASLITFSLIKKFQARGQGT